MATFYPLELAGVTDGTIPPLKKDGRISMAAIRRSRYTFPLTGQAIGDIGSLGSIPEGAAFAFAILTASVSLGAATVAIGTATVPAKYKAAGTLTATDTPTLAGTTAGVGAAPLSTAPDALVATIGAAALPNGGTLVIDIYYSMR